MPLEIRFRLFVIAALVAGAFSTHCAAAEKAAGVPIDATIRVMSFNARYGTAPDGENAWDQRIGIFFETIRRFGPDLIGFQEVLVFQRDEVEKQMSDYSFYGVGPEDGAKKGQMSRIDFVFCTPHFRPTAASIDRSSRDGRYPSDHYPVSAVFVPGDCP